MTAGNPPRALVVTDSDSYVKWGAALAGQVPPDWTMRLVVTSGNALPSDRQLSAALEGTRFRLDEAEIVSRADLVGLFTTWRPDVVVVAARGLTVLTVTQLVPKGPSRPVVVSGLAGISIPVLSPGLRLRASVDVFVVHSRRELREFADTCDEIGIAHRLELATLPFLATAPGHASSVEARARAERDPVRDRIVFAAQAIVPASRTDRVWLLRRLVETARAHPDLLVVIKVRARRGEPQTHVEQFPYEELIADLVDAGEPMPANLVVEDGPMAWHMARAVGLATISSTAVLEGVAAGVPCLALNDFGVGAQQINLVLAGSGLLARSDDLVAGRFRSPAPEWREDNYLHDPADDTWIVAVQELLQRRTTHGLPPLRPQPRDLAHRVRAAVYGRLAFVPPARQRPDVWHRAFLRVGFWEHRRRWALRRLHGRDRDGVAPTSGSRA
ncbi:MAG: DUF6716 putative glycosyltransferase [Aeromicrobium sp.]